MGIKPAEIKIDQERLMSLAPLLIQGAIILFFVFLVLIPQLKKIGSLSTQIKEKRDSLILMERGSSDMVNKKKKIADLEKKAADYEQRLPVLLETNMLIDSVRAITQESKLKFSSIEPMSPVRFELPDSKEVYFELPIKIRLRCSFFEMVDFFKKIETSKRLMKISMFSVQANPQNPWEHEVEVTISNFSRSNKENSK